MPGNALAFVFGSDNTQSLSALIGAIEADGRFGGLDIRLLKPKLGLGDQVAQLALGCDRLVVGFSFTTPKAPEVATLVGQLRKRLSAHSQDNVTLVGGGPHPSGAWRQTLGMGFDIVVVGEGEISFSELLASLYAGAGFGRVKGLAFCEGGATRFTGRSPRVAGLDDYPPFAERFRLFSSLEITRGCHWACRYCQTSFLMGGQMRHRSIEGILRWVEVSKRYDKTDIRFITPDAFAYGSEDGTQRLDRLAAMLAGVSDIVGRQHTYLGSFPSEVRPDSVSREAVELVREFCVNDNLLIGAQSGSQRMLDLAHRGHTVDDIYRAVRITLAAGLLPIVDFIFGMPGETEVDREWTRKVVADLAQLGARIHSHAFMPLAGTPWAGAPPGALDPQTRELLERLTGTGQHFGQWRGQERAAAAVAARRRAADAR